VKYPPRAVASFVFLPVAWALCALAMGTSARAADCQNAELALALERLQGLENLHNCQIELVSRVSHRGMKQYMLLANDLAPLANGERSPVSFEFEIDPACVAASPRATDDRTVRYSYGYSTSRKDYRVAITIQTGHGALPTAMIIQSIDLMSHQIDQRVACRLDPEGL
jgi:hypothetical protein